MTIRRLPIKNYPGYWATSLGKIYSDKRDIYLTIHLNKSGTPCVQLRKNNKLKHFTLRRLLFKTFYPNQSLNNKFVTNKFDYKNSNIDNLKLLPRGDMFRLLNSIRRPNRGVYKYRGRWRVVFKVNNKAKTFGYYKTKKEAKEMYKKYFNEQYENINMSKM